MMLSEVPPPLNSTCGHLRARRARPNMATWGLQAPSLTVGGCGATGLVLRLAQVLPTVSAAWPTSLASRRCRRDRPAPQVTPTTRASITIITSSRRPGRRGSTHRWSCRGASEAASSASAWTERSLAVPAPPHRVPTAGTRRFRHHDCRHDAVAVTRSVGVEASGAVEAPWRHRPRRWRGRSDHWRCRRQLAVSQQPACSKSAIKTAWISMCQVKKRPI